jgi:hypothetical protein
MPRTLGVLKVCSQETCELIVNAKKWPAGEQHETHETHGNTFIDLLQPFTESLMRRFPHSMAWCEVRSDFDGASSPRHHQFPLAFFFFAASPCQPR